jgi:hypothetical protein
MFICAAASFGSTILRKTTLQGGWDDRKRRWSNPIRLAAGCAAAGESVGALVVGWEIGAGTGGVGG